MTGKIDWKKQPYKTILRHAINKKAAIEIVILRQELHSHIYEKI
jgi:hypothetical protein